MGTKDLTHDAIAQALTNGDPLTQEQRGVLLGLVADDKVWQRKCDLLQAELASERERCAQICDQIDAMSRDPMVCRGSAEECAAAIRGA